MMNSTEDSSTVRMDQSSGKKHNGLQLSEEPTSLGTSFFELHDDRAEKPPALKSLRYLVMALALVCPFATVYSKTIINFAIIDMIDPEFMLAEKQHDANEDHLLINGTTPYFDLDHSCPVTDESDRFRLLHEMDSDTRRARTGSGDKFKWDTFKQGLLKGAYSIGTMLFQIPGSRLSEMYGAHRVLGAGALLITTSCLLAPSMAALSFYLIFVDLLLLGIWGSFMIPAFITLSINWLTPSEKSFMVSVRLVSSKLGVSLSSLICGMLIEAQYSWRYAFFSAGWVSLAVAVLILVGTRSRPQDHPFISELELEYLATKNTLVREALERDRTLAAPNGATPKLNGSQPTLKAKKAPAAPWLAILTNVPVIALIMTKFCIKLSTETTQVELPAYLKRAMHFSAKRNGMVNSLNYVIACVSYLVIGALAARCNKMRPFGASKTTLRKIFQSISSFGVAFCLIGISFSVCNDTLTQIFLIAMYFIATFTMGGEAQGPMDLTERYSGTIHAVANSLSFGGVIEPALVGYLMRGQPNNRDSWRFVWLGTSAIAFLGGLIFLIFGQAGVQPFDNLHKEKEDQQAREEATVVNTLDGRENRGFEIEVKT